MDIVSYNQKQERRVALALGFFDCIHCGHRELLLKAISNARKNNNTVSGIFTFNNNPFDYLNNPTKLIFTFFERLEVLKELGVDLIVNAEFSSNFKNIPYETFLNTINNNLQLQSIICGKDHRIGKNGLGDTNAISRFCDEHSIEFDVLDDYIVDGKKVSSSLIRQLLSEGNVRTANSLLCTEYFTIGNVVSGRGDGFKLGFPTANIEWAKDKLLPKEGVYHTITTLNGKRYMSATNIGAKPTFQDSSISAETFIIDFKGDLYNQSIKISFLDRIRDIIRFPSATQLKAQIQKDVEYIKNQDWSRIKKG